MVNRSTPPIPIAMSWNSPPSSSKNYLVNVIAELVQRQLSKPLQTEENCDEYRAIQSSIDPAGQKWQDHISTSGSKGRDFLSANPPSNKCIVIKSRHGYNTVLLIKLFVWVGHAYVQMG